MKRIFIGAAIAAFIAAGPALAADVKPALVYGTGGKFDKSFNEAGYNGAEKFKTETGVAYRDFEPQDDTQGEQAIRKFASEGFSPIVALSFAWTDAVAKVSKEFPDTKFVLVDSVIDAPNVRSVVFKEDECSYLVGLLADRGRQVLDLLADSGRKLLDLLADRGGELVDLLAHGGRKLLDLLADVGGKRLRLLGQVDTTGLGARRQHLDLVLQLVRGVADRRDREVADAGDGVQRLGVDRGDSRHGSDLSDAGQSCGVGRRVGTPAQAFVRTL